MAAVAVPEGKGSCSMFIICRFTGTAINTPSIETDAAQIIICQAGNARPVMRYNAGMDEIKVADEI